MDSTYYRYVLLSQHMLPGIRQLAGEVYVFQQDNAPVYRARLTRRQYATWLNRGSDWLRSGLTSNGPLLTGPLTSGGKDSRPLSKLRGSISNSCCNLYLYLSFIVCCDSIFLKMTKSLQKTFQDVMTGTFQFQFRCGTCYAYNCLIIL